MQTWLTDIVDACHSDVLARVPNIRTKIGRIFCFIISTSKITSFCRRNFNEPPNIYELNKINQAGTQIVLNFIFYLFPKLVFFQQRKKQAMASYVFMYIFMIDESVFSNKMSDGPDDSTNWILTNLIMVTKLTGPKTLQLRESDQLIQ